MTTEEMVAIKAALKLLPGDPKGAAALLAEMVPADPPYVEFPKYLPDGKIARDAEHEKELTAKPAADAHADARTAPSPPPTAKR